MKYGKYDIDVSNIPRHIAVIMDGNGRWANSRGLERVLGHREGAESARTIIRTCREIGVGVLTLFSFSTENWQRPKKEINALVKLLVRLLDSEREDMVAKGIRLRAIGEISRFPDSVVNKLNRVMNDTEHNSGLILNLALNYGARDEILKAVRDVAKQIALGTCSPEDITESLFSSYLYTGSVPDPDLLIRTGGEYRLSNFLLWQIAYTEIYVSSKHWPDFRENDLYQAIYDYQQRERRFGKTGRQVQREDKHKKIKGT